MIAIVVNNCAGCPFVVATESQTEPWLCDALQWEGYPREIPEQRVAGNRWPDPPDWCPLREADRLVTLRVK
jgi:hypothetical protein